MSFIQPFIFVYPYSIQNALLSCDLSSSCVYITLLSVSSIPFIQISQLPVDLPYLSFNLLFFFPHNTYFLSTFSIFLYIDISIYFLLYQVSLPYLSFKLSFSLFYISLPFTLFIFSFLILSRLSSTVFTLLSLTLSKISSFHFHPYLILPYSIHCHPCLSQTFHFPNFIFFSLFYQCIFHTYYLTVQFLI